MFYAKKQNMIANTHRITNAMTVDVEDYFQVSAFEHVLPRDIWSTMPIRVEYNTREILALFDEHRVKATFFVLGWVAEKFPQLVRDIAAQGHEVASHGFWHQRVHTLSPAEFRKDISQSKKILEDLSGQPVKGYRAPTYSINLNTQWAFAILEDCGYTYSSSIYPIKHDLYGWPTAPRFMFTATPKGLIEIPITTLRWQGKNLPCGGGGYFRLFPYTFSRWALNRINHSEKRPCIFYFHPWEIDPKQPRQPNINFKTKFRHYHNLSTMRAKITCLMEDFNWGTIDHVFFRSSNTVNSPAFESFNACIEH